jgi:hypothetical protein
MTDLRTAAQAVLDAMHRSYDHEPTRRAIAANILRTLADMPVMWINEDYLLAIAAELEGADV